MYVHVVIVWSCLNVVSCSVNVMVLCHAVLLVRMHVWGLLQVTATCSYAQAFFMDIRMYMAQGNMHMYSPSIVYAIYVDMHAVQSHVHRICVWCNCIPEAL